MAIGTWRQMPPSKTQQAPKKPLPGHPMLTGYNQGQAEDLKESAAAMATTIKNIASNDVPSNGGTGDSVADASEAGAKTPGQTAKVAEWSLWWGPVLR